MTSDEINVAIAEHCGWTNIRVRPHIVEGWPDVLAGIDPTKGCEQAVPNYCGDLNAMHEAEKTLTLKQALHFDYLLRGTVVNRMEWMSRSDSFTWHATARQRAEAFLKTTGKWKD